jgi:hypothetical protein
MILAQAPETYLGYCYIIIVIILLFNFCGVRGGTQSLAHARQAPTEQPPSILSLFLMAESKSLTI